MKKLLVMALLSLGCLIPKAQAYDVGFIYPDGTTTLTVTGHSDGSTTIQCTQNGITNTQNLTPTGGDGVCAVNIFWTVTTSHTLYIFGPKGNITGVPLYYTPWF